jgi:hypothetical protein
MSNEITANSMTITGQVVFTMNIPKKDWCNSVKPCSEACVLYDDIKQFNIKNVDNAVLSMMEQNDSVIVKITTPDIKLDGETPEGTKGWIHLEPGLGTVIPSIENVMWRVRGDCLYCMRLRAWNVRKQQFAKQIENSLLSR